MNAKNDIPSHACLATVTILSCTGRSVLYSVVRFYVYCPGSDQPQRSVYSQYLIRPLFRGGESVCYRGYYICALMLLATA